MQICLNCSHWPIDLHQLCIMVHVIVKWPYIGVKVRQLAQGHRGVTLMIFSPRLLILPNFWDDNESQLYLYVDFVLYLSEQADVTYCLCWLNMWILKCWRCWICVGFNCFIVSKLGFHSTILLEFWSDINSDNVIHW